MNTKNILIYSGLLLGGLLLGFLFFGGNSEPQSLDEHIAETHTDEDGNVVYTCSMHPQVRQNEPGNCPICGMELIPADDAESAAGPNTLVMSQAAMELADIQTSSVVKGTPVATLYLPGKVTINPNNESGVTAHVPGRITELYVDFEGDYVQKGEKMASVYSPELIAAQQELLETAKYKEQNPVLYQSARRKLELWELPLSTINEIEESGTVMENVDIVSPVSGYVSAINVSRQQHLMEGTLMYTVADLSSVWVMFDVYESQLTGIREAQAVTFTTASLPGQEFKGTIEYVDPLLSDRSRSLQVRVKASNPGNRLKPNMLAEAVVQASTASEEELLIPRSAVLWTGKRSIVFVKQQGVDQPSFEAREIILGERVGNQYIVADGLEEGEEVVSNGTFKLDSAAQLADKLSMMNRTPGTGANRTGHEGHTMPGDSEPASGTAVPAETQDHSEHQSMEDSSIPDAVKEQLKEVIVHYLSMKDAFVESDREQATASANEVMNALSQVNMALLQGDAHVEWMRFLKQLETDTQTIASASTIEEQREAFTLLSPKLIEVVKYFEVPGVFYQQFCPMSNNGEGAYWLSTSEEIANPYFGSQMLSCGETITKIEF